MKIKLLPIFAIAFLAASCGSKTESAFTMSGLDPSKFESVIDGVPSHLYTITNTNGMEVCITNFGGRIVSVMVPDKDGVMRDVVEGFDNVQDYQNIPSDFGASIGRYANRIGGATFELNGQTIELLKNDNQNSLHGGPKGWQYQMYTAEQVSPSCLKLFRDSPDGDQNYPGHVQAVVTYSLGDDNSIDVKYSVTTDAPTIINMTHHSYFNLSGDPSVPATDEIIYINASAFTPTSNDLIPTGEIRSVEGTPLDLRTPKVIGDDVESDYEPMQFAGGYDHNWCLDTNCDINVLAAKLTSPKTGISVEVYTDQPGIQFYSGNFIPGTFTGKNGILYPKRSGVCLETQIYPDAVHHPEWGQNPYLNPGETYTHECIYKFTVEK